MADIEMPMGQVMFRAKRKSPSPQALEMSRGTLSVPVSSGYKMFPASVADIVARDAYLKKMKSLSTGLKISNAELATYANAFAAIHTLFPLEHSLANESILLIHEGENAGVKAFARVLQGSLGAAARSMDVSGLLYRDPAKSFGRDSFKLIIIPRNLLSHQTLMSEKHPDAEKSRIFDPETFLCGSYGILKTGGALLIAGEDGMNKVRVPAFGLEPVVRFRISEGSPIFFMKRTISAERIPGKPAARNYHRNKTWADLERNKKRT